MAMHHELDKTIESIEKIMRLMWDMLPEKDQALLAHAYAFALIRRIANKGLENK
jgi:hypothetical protein